MKVRLQNKGLYEVWLLIFQCVKTALMWYNVLTHDQIQNFKIKEEARQIEKVNAWNDYYEKQLAELEARCGEYRDFQSRGKTEREGAALKVQMAEAAGYWNLEKIIKAGETLKACDKVYAVIMDKAVVLLYIGSEALEKGMNILGAHIDSPRKDVK